jgi:hypothetical protein
MRILQLLCILLLLPVPSFAQAYLHAQNGKVLQVPKPLDGGKLSNYFVIPATSVQPGTLPAPPGSALARAQRTMIVALPATAVVMKLVAGEPMLWVNQSLQRTRALVHSILAKQLLPQRPAQQLWFYDSYTTFDRVRADTPVYVVQLQRVGAATQLLIRQKNGQRVRTSVSKRLLKTLSRGLQGKTTRGLGAWFSRFIHTDS